MARRGCTPEFRRRIVELVEPVELIYWAQNLRGSIRMKTVGKVVVAIFVVLGAGYTAISRTQPTIDQLSNPNAVNNLHLIEENPETGFAIYRLGEPDASDIRGLCALGISEIVVLAGTALEHERTYQEECPGLEVIYNVEDDLSPLNDQWLNYFDHWIQRARESGRKIAFRCTCGCHRTGRLAAYYQMKYRGLSTKDAWDLSLSRGFVMEAVDYFSGLQQQIIALHEYIHDVPCSQEEHCVGQKSPAQQPCDEPLQGCGWQSELL